MDTHVYWKSLLVTFESYKLNIIFFILANLYLPMLYLGTKYMKTRAKFQIVKITFFWNFFIGSLSFYGAYHTFPYLIIKINTLGLQDTICNLKGYNNPENYFIQLVCFIYCTTKIFEWIDTILLILKKKKIIFLHWFHHLVTMLFCWHSIYNSIFCDFTGLFYASINLTVHAIMYYYYALKTIKVKIPKVISVMITLIQVIQMFLGIYVLYKSLNCKLTLKNNMMGILFGFSMYSIYLILFLKILLNYFWKLKIN